MLGSSVQHLPGEDILTNGEKIRSQKESKKLKILIEAG
jgi:hypothetical protein